jgi:glycosyltransferase involved in cell wall biosynthesis
VSDRKGGGGGIGASEASGASTAGEAGETSGAAGAGRTAVVFVAGRDPRDELSGGHSAYVRSYARAALAGGFQPHLFCAARDSRVDDTDFGTVHRVASPVRPFRQTMAGAHAFFVVRAIERWVRARAASEAVAAMAAMAAMATNVSRAAVPAPVLLHGFGVWGVIAVRAARRLVARGIPAVAVVGSYTTYEEESRAKVRGAETYGLRQRLALRAEHLWIRLCVERWEREAYLGAARVLINYDSVRRLVQAKYGTAARCEYLPYTCESAFLRAAGRGDAAAGGGGAGAPCLVAVSRHDTRKGVDLLLHALARLHAEGVPLRAQLIGGGPLLDVHRRLAARLGLSAVVTLTGPVPDPFLYLAAADVYVLPSREEQSGSLALLEAMQTGVAIVASGVDGILEDVVDGVDAILVTPEDVDELVDALRSTLTDPVLRRRLAESACSRFAENFAPDVVRDGLRALYESLSVHP